MHRCNFCERKHPAGWWREEWNKREEGRINVATEIPTNTECSGFLEFHPWRSETEIFAKTGEWDVVVFLAHIDIDVMLAASNGTEASSGFEDRVLGTRFGDPAMHGIMIGNWKYFWR